MKIFTAALFAGIPNLSSASLMYTDFGGCMNRELQAADNGTVSFHCHFDSTFCVDGEEFLTAAEVAAEGLGLCTCDDDFNSNVYTTGCYDLQSTHAVECAPNFGDCPEGWMMLGNRFNSDHTVDESCGHNDAAFGQDDKTSCGKRCTCNFQYQSRDTKLQVRSTQYGLCFDSIASTSYCAVNEDTCYPGETYFGPHSSTLTGSNQDCQCANVHVGGCMDGNTFSHCAVTIDNCSAEQTHLMPRALREANGEVDCRLCRDDFALPPVAAPVTVPVAAPVAAPVTAPVATPVAAPTSILSVPTKSKTDDDDTVSTTSSAFVLSSISVVGTLAMNVFLYL